MAGTSKGRGDILVTLEEDAEERDWGGAWLSVWFRRNPRCAFNLFEDCQRLVSLCEGVASPEAGSLLERTMEADYQPATVAREQLLGLTDEHPWAVSDLQSAFER